MKGRCRDKNDIGYSRYGGRGIKVCDRWLGPDGFEHFLEDMGARPEGYTLDRIDNDKDYSPDNCRWADLLTQTCNRRTNIKVPGVYYRSDKPKKWHARIVFNNKSHNACFATYPEAVAQRLAWEKEFWGHH